MLQMTMASVDAVSKKSHSVVSKKNQPATELNSAKTKVFLSTNGNELGVNIVLKGDYMGAEVGVLRDFFSAVSYYPATAWTLHMEEVELISLRGILIVADFLRIIHQRGQAVKIAGIHENICNTLRDLKLARAFDLADCSSIAWSH